MMAELHTLLSQLLLVFSSVLCGLYFTFSNTVMPTLARQAHGSGIECMQGINRQIQNPVFFVLFFGSAFIALALLLLQTVSVHYHLSGQTLVAACLTMTAFLSTLTVNVPCNNRLDRLSIYSPDAHGVWLHYLDRWVFWNHVRTVATLGSTILMANQLHLT